MTDSPPQFQQLLAHLAARVNQMLAAKEALVPLGLVLRDDGKIDVSIGVAGSAPNVQAMTVLLRQTLVKLVAGGGVQASCIAFPHEANAALIALLETRDNDCATVSIPLLTQPQSRLDTDNMQIDEGYIYVFPVLDDD